MGNSRNHRDIKFVITDEENKLVSEPNYYKPKHFLEKYWQLK